MGSDDGRWCSCYRGLNGSAGAAPYVEDASAKLVASVDEFLGQAGKWGRFQTRLSAKVCLFYAFIGVDNLLAAFLAPTLAEQWGLSLVQQQCLSSFWFAGGLVGFLASGTFADTFGRRPALLLFSAFKLLGDVLTFLAPSLRPLLFARVFTSFGTAGAFNVCYPILAEHSLAESLARITQALGLVWQAGVVYLVAVAYLVQGMAWQALALSLVPGVAATLWLWIDLPESPRFLQVQGKHREATMALRRLAKVNGYGNLNLKLAAGPQQAVEAEAKSKETEETVEGVGQLMKMLFARKQALRTVVVLLINFVSSGSYYGLCFAPLGFLGANMFVAQLGATVLEAPAVMVIAPLADTFGRIRSLTGLFALYALALLALAFLPSDATNWRLIALLLARSSGQAHMTLKWVVNAENFPTVIRSVGLAIGGVCGQFGAVVGPMLFAAVPAPFLILALLCLPAMLCLQSLPETAGADLE